MTISTQTNRRRNYNPAPLHRKVRHQFVTPDGIAVGLTKSFRDQTHEYSPVVNLADGSCSCTCPDFEFRKAKQHPAINKPESLCKHLVRYVARLEARGELQPESAPVAVEAPHMSTHVASAKPTAESRSAALSARIARGEVSLDDLF